MKTIHAALRLCSLCLMATLAAGCPKPFPETRRSETARTTEAAAAPAENVPAAAPAAPTATAETAPEAAPAVTPETPDRDPTAAPDDVAAPPANATRTASGLVRRVLRKGSGTRRPLATSTVEVHYSGWTTDGKLFDSSYARQKTISFPLNRVIKGWTEGVQLMVEGEKSRFWIPSELAYGDNPGGGRPGGMLVFDIELIAIR